MFILHPPTPKNKNRWFREQPVETTELEYWIRHEDKREFWYHCNGEIIVESRNSKPPALMTNSECCLNADSNSSIHSPPDHSPTSQRKWAVASSKWHKRSCAKLLCSGPGKNQWAREWNRAGRPFNSSWTVPGAWLRNLWPIQESHYCTK